MCDKANVRLMCMRLEKLNVNSFKKHRQCLFMKSSAGVYDR